MLKTIILPRQARDKHKQNTPKGGLAFAGVDVLESKGSSAKCAAAQGNNCQDDYGARHAFQLTFL